MKDLSGTFRHSSKIVGFPYYIMEEFMGSEDLQGGCDKVTLWLLLSSS